MRPLLPAVLLLSLSGCATVVARHPLPDSPPMDYAQARKQAVALLKQAQLERAGFSVATIKGGFKFDLGDRGLTLSYIRYQGLLDDQGAPAQTSCAFEVMDDLAVTEYSNKYWPYAIALGPQCDDLGLYIQPKERAFDLARALSDLKKLTSELPAPGTAGLSQKDLANIVQAAVAGATQGRQPGAQAFSGKSDVDAPSFRLPERKDDLAVVVGVGKYSDLPEAQFAERDAEAVKEHLLALGFPSRNVVHLAGEKAGYKGIEKFVETWLPRNVEADSRVVFYFSGHGAPDAQTGKAYLLPYDGDPNFLENTGYPVQRLYEKLSALKAKEVLVALDACFSGAGGRSVLAKGARPLVLKTDSSSIPGGLTVLAAASGEQITSTLEDQGHGTFTYYFLKGLGGAAKDASGAVTAQGLYDYLRPKVQDAARRQNREQSPVLQGPADLELARF